MIIPHIEDNLDRGFYYDTYMIRDYYVQIDYQEEGLKVTAFYAPILENGEKRIE